MPTSKDPDALQLETVPQGNHPLSITADPVAKMLESIVSKGITAESVGALEKLADLYERMQAKDAERQFTSAFVALQSELPVIVASTPIPNRGKYERFEDVMKVVSPLLVKHGFTVSFSMDFKENRILETCHLKHVGGHSQSNSFAVRSGRADSDTQADCKAATTAKRNALLNCLNIVIRKDAMQNEEGDASLEGSPITRDQAQVLREMVRDTQSDEAKFLEFAGVPINDEHPKPRYDQIMSGRYDELFTKLNGKRNRR